ncbi:MAG: hypothetical protein HKN89_08575 [Eudoraea sp.]|nr:hypothetical protein [Eudoraea sp.]
MPVCLHPTYFPNVQTFSVILSNDIVWEVHDNYQKQTYRNRCHICTDQGKHTLSVPIKHVGGHEGRQLYSDVRLDDSTPWQRQHWRGIQTAYRTSPYFEFYEDDLAPLFEPKFSHLMELNFEILDILGELIGFEVSKTKTTSYSHDLSKLLDGRFLVNAKSELHDQPDAYHQVFNDRHGFIENLSILDVLFNLGPETSAYLKKVWDQSFFPALKR